MEHDRKAKTESKLNIFWILDDEMWAMMQKTFKVHSSILTQTLLATTRYWMFHFLDAEEALKIYPNSWRH